MQRDNPQTPQKTSITQRLRTDLGRNSLKYFLVLIELSSQKKKPEGNLHKVFLSLYDVDSSIDQPKKCFI